ncbi:MAG: sigma-70 family RNA polymerase sigma factor [Bacteroidota bacterium]
MEQAEFIALVRTHQKLIYKICHSYCQNTQDWQDLEQEVLLQLWSAMPKYDGRVQISTWIYKVALNTAIAFYRKGKKYKSPKVSIDEQVLAMPDPAGSTIVNEQLVQLHQFIGALPPLNKALMLLYLDDYKPKEIAAILGISRTNVSTKLNRIKKQLQEQFKKV